MSDASQLVATHSGILNLVGFEFHCYVLSNTTACLSLNDFVKNTLIPREVIELVANQIRSRHDQPTIYEKVKILDKKSSEYGQYIDMIESNFCQELIRCGVSSLNTGNQN